MARAKESDREREVRRRRRRKGQGTEREKRVGGGGKGEGKEKHRSRPDSIRSLEELADRIDRRAAHVVRLQLLSPHEEKREVDARPGKALGEVPLGGFNNITPRDHGGCRPLPCGVGIVILRLGVKYGWIIVGDARHLRMGARLQLRLVWCGVVWWCGRLECCVVWCEV